MAKTSMIAKSLAHAEIRRAQAQPLQSRADVRAASFGSSRCAASASARTRINGVVPGVTKASW